MLKVPIREGYPFAATLTFSAGIDTRYSAGRFVVRERPDPAARAIVECDESSGLAIDHANARVLISIDGVATDDLGVNDRTLQCWGEIRLSDPLNPGDRIGGQFAVAVVPSLFA